MLKVYGPIVFGAAEEFPAALAQLGAEHGLGGGRLGLLGGSIGALVAQEAAATTAVDAVALVSPVIRLRPLVVAEAAEAFARARAAHGEQLQDRLDETGTASPRTNGRGRRHLTAWPPWEALERERDVGLLEERGRIDLKLVVVRELGRHGLDGALGIDLMRALLDEMRTVGAEGPRDWESWIEWTNGFDEGWVEAVLRRGLQAGRYELD